MHSQLWRHRQRRPGGTGHPGGGPRVRRRHPRDGAAATGRPGDRQGERSEWLRVRHRPARERDRGAKAKAGLVSTTAGVDRPFGPPPQFPAPDDRAPASALDLAQAADYLERITKALEKQVRHEHVPWDRAYPITIQPTSSYTLQTPNPLSGFAFSNQTGQTIYARLGDSCSSTSYDVLVPTGQFCRYERRDWEVPFVTFYNPGAAAMTLVVLVGRPVPDLNVLPLALTTAAPADGQAGQSGLIVVSQPRLFNGSTWDRPSGNSQRTLLHMGS